MNREGGHVKVVVTAMGEGLEAGVDPRFGRAVNFILVDLDTGDHQTVKNALGESAAHGAGIRAAEQVSGLGATHVITGRCGPKAQQALQAAGVKIMVGATGSVQDAIEQFKAGQLSSLDGPGPRRGPAERR